jgi:anti-sigma factor RsiW
MMTPGCLWNRLRLERLVDGALGTRLGRRATAHLGRCEACRNEVARLRRLRLLIRSAELEVADPDWSGFWPTVRVRIASGGAPDTVRDPWWLPFWKPVWGHPRVAVSGIVVSSLALMLMLWPSAPAPVSTVLAAPIQVQDVSTADPDRSVMVYSNPDQDVTVIWVFNALEQDEQS